MDARQVERIEAIVELVAAAIFAAAVGFSAVRLGWSLGAAGAAAAAALFAGGRLLRTIGDGPAHFAIAPFEAPPLPEPVEPDELLLVDPVELLLTDADRLDPLEPDVLPLDDVLARLEPDSRVVRLFDPAAMPTPGELKDRIDRHLDWAPTPSDASQALHDALAQLRRSLR